MAKKRKAPNLCALIQEAVVDWNSEEEEHVGLMTMVEENVACPFMAKVIGEEVEVVELCSSETSIGVDAVCRYKGKDYRIGFSLEWPKKKPEGYDWVEAYRAWRTGQY